MEEAERPALDRAIAEVEEQFGVMITRVRASMRQRAARIHPQLQPAGYKILALLVRGGATHTGELVEHLATDKSIVSRQLRLLEQAGLVKREVDPRDRRAHVLAATESARRRLAEIRSEDQSALYNKLSGWPVEDVRSLGELLRRLNGESQQ